MFGVGLPELAVIFVVGVIVFGPDRLPEMARQAGRLIWTVRRLAQNAQRELRNELGPEYADLRLTDLDPRAAIRKHILEALEEEDLREAYEAQAELDPLLEGERPPFDIDAT